MFLKMHRTKEKTEQDAGEENGALVKEIENLEELVSKRALGLEETKEQLEQLSVSLDSAEEGDDKAAEADALLFSPVQPAGEGLAVEAKEEATKGGEAHSEPVSIIDFFSRCKELCDNDRSIVVVSHSYAFEEEMLSRTRSLCDAHFRLKLEQIGDKMAKIMEVLKVRGADRPTGEVVTFEVEPKIGMRIIPLAKAKV